MKRKMVKKDGKKQENVEANEKSMGDDNDPLCERVVWEDSMDDEAEMDQDSHENSHHSQESARPSKG